MRLYKGDKIKKIKISQFMINALLGKSKDSVRGILLQEIVKANHHVFYSDPFVPFNTYLMYRFKVSRPRTTQVVNILIEEDIIEKITPYIIHIKELKNVK